MNRALLLIICDFLLLSLLALARFDEPEGTAQDEPPPEEARTPEEAREADLVAAMREALEAEAVAQRELRNELRAREEALDTTREELAQTSQAFSQARAELDETRMTAEELAAANQRLQTERQRLDAAVSTLQEDREAVLASLAETKESEAEKEARLRLLQEQLQERMAALEAARQEQERLAREREQLALREQRLQTELRVKETESQILQENLRSARTEVQTVRAEKEWLAQTTERLTTGVSELAQGTRSIQEEMRQNTPISPNEIFDKYRANRLYVEFTARTPGLFGDSERTYEAPSLFVTNGTGTYVLFHSEDTPFRVTSENPARLKSVQGRLRAGDFSYPISGVSFLRDDPRVLVIQVPPDMPTNAGREVYTFPPNPLRFPEAVLIGKGDAYYGQIPFKLASDAENVLDLQVGTFTRLFGEFKPSPGDLVFAQTGELLGIMLNNDKALMIEDFQPLRSLGVGSAFDPDEANDLIDRLGARLPRR